MKIGKLYIKIYLSYLFITLVSGIMIAAIFHLTTSETYHDEFMKYLNGAVTIFREHVNERFIKRGNLNDLQNNKEFADFIVRFNREFNTKVWAEFPDGETINYPEGDLPVQLNNGLKSKDGYYYKIKKRRKAYLYLKVPIDVQGKHICNIYFYRRWMPPLHQPFFVFGLLAAGLIIAVLLYPFSRYISIPVKRLIESANNISKGDFSKRVNVKSNDEIGQLADSFNTMAGTVEGMIKGTKELTANISHELRSPLTRIRVAQELLEEKIGGRDPESNKLLAAINSEIEEMDKLIGQVIMLTRLDTGEQVIQREEILLSEIVNEVIDKYKPAFENKNIELMSEIKDGNKIYGVKDNIRTAISNLIDNAVKYSKKGGRVKVHIAESGEGKININIYNTARELSEEELLNIFRPFYRISGEETRGTGLGLAITKKIIENHKGTVSAAGTDEGLMIRICLPAL